MLPDHFELGASGAYRWMVCPGSIAASRGMPDTSNVHSIEGTAAHQYAELCLTNNLDPVEHFLSCTEAVQIVKGTEVTVTEEMAEAVKVYVDFVKALPGGDKFVEHKFDLRQYFDGMPFGGTADFVAYDHDSKTLYVIDYKHGKGHAVEVENNSQLKYYALGAMLTLGYAVQDVVMVVVQPRCNHPDGQVRQSVLSAVELLDFMEELREAGKRALANNAPRVSGEHCRFCKAAALCPELAGAAQAMAKAEFGPVVEYDAAKLKVSLDMLPLLEHWIKSVREFAYNEASRGRCPPGYKLVEKRATRKWTDDFLVENWLKSHDIDLEVCHETKLKSPAQMEKVLKPFGVKLDDTLCTKESSGYTLVPESDKRPEVRTLTAAAEFKPVENQESENG